jgi:hypothetical protein
VSNAPDVSGDARTFLIVHPFHPCHGRRFAVVAVRKNWGEDRIYYHDARGQLTGIAAHWTDMAPADPVVALSAGRSPFRFEDLMELSRLLASLQSEGSHAH